MDSPLLKFSKIACHNNRSSLVGLKSKCMASRVGSLLDTLIKQETRTKGASNVSMREFLVSLSRRFSSVSPTVFLVALILLDRLLGADSLTGLNSMHLP